METRSLLLSITVASVLAAASAASAQEAAPDTSEWTCSKCPFDRGYRAAVELGGAYVDESSAKYGDYTGLDEEGGYVVAGAEGKASTESGYTLSYELTDLGLDSREARIEGGKQGRYEFGLFYDRIPHTIYDTTATVFGGVGGTGLTLPAAWVPAGSTGGMTALDDSLYPVDVGVDRDRYGASGAFWWGENLAFSLDYRRDERDGTRPQLAAIGGTSAQLLRPVDDATDRLDARVRYQGAKWFAEIGYSGSLYDTKAAQLNWENPFNPMVPGAEDGRMALAPDNDYHEVSLSTGWYGLPGHTAVTVSLATGRGSQDIGFLPYTANPLVATDALPITSLDGDMTVTRADLTVSSRPIDRLRLRGAVVYDERDNDSRQAAFTTPVFTDAFPITEEFTNAVYGFERLRAYGSADFQVYEALVVGLGGEYRNTDRTGTEREVMSEETWDGWGRLQYRPTGYLGFVAKGGVEERKPDEYDTTIGDAYGQNPLLGKYDMAYRYRSYGEFVANVALGQLPLTLSASAFYADDSYTRSDLGLLSGISRRYAADLAWTINESVTAYVSGGQERIDSKTAGSSTFSAPDWRGEVEDEFTTYGGGLTARFGDDVRLDIGYTHADGDSNTTITGAGAGAFPSVSSDLDSFRADFNYGLTERLDVVFSWQHERFDSDDWALAGVEPATLPTVLALGADPYEYSVNYVAASLRYYFGPRKVELPE
jgi:MtrB/PioB family decaheme-associated outer membrane protein